MKLIVLFTILWVLRVLPQLNSSSWKGGGGEGRKGEGWGGEGRGDKIDNADWENEFLY